MVQNQINSRIIEKLFNTICELDTVAENLERGDLRGKVQSAGDLLFEVMEQLQRENHNENHS
jgi:hypothetical protein